MVSGRVGLMGSPDDPQVAALVELLGDRAWVIDSQSFPSKVALTVRRPDLRSIYVRQIHTPGADSYVEIMARRETSAFLIGWLLEAEEGGVRLVNSPRHEIYGNKPYQLALFRKAGIPAPETLITNDPAEVRAFAGRHERVIFKPVAGGATTRLLERRDLDRLDLLRSAPVLFQEYIPGENIRAYVVGGRVVASAVIETTDDYDFRRAEGRVVSVDLPEDIRDLCLAAARLCRLDFTAIDLRRDGSRHVFLEANNTPMWAGFDAKSGLRVGSALAAFLAEDVRSTR